MIFTRFPTGLFQALYGFIQKRRVHGQICSYGYFSLNSDFFITALL
jgi:hypothetical protein